MNDYFPLLLKNTSETFLRRSVNYNYELLGYRTCLYSYINIAIQLGYWDMWKQIWEDTFLKVWLNTNFFKSKTKNHCQSTNQNYIEFYFSGSLMNLTVLLFSKHKTDIKPKVLHDPWNFLEFLKKYSGLWEEVLMRTCAVRERKKSSLLTSGALMK